MKKIVCMIVLVGISCSCSHFGSNDSKESEFIEKGVLFRKNKNKAIPPDMLVEVNKLKDAELIKKVFEQNKIAAFILPLGGDDMNTYLIVVWADQVDEAFELLKEDKTLNKIEIEQKFSPIKKLR